MLERTWPYGTQRRGRVDHVAQVEGRRVVTVIDLDVAREAYILIGDSCTPDGAERGDQGILTFMKGGPTGGYWRFEREGDT